MTKTNDITIAVKCAPEINILSNAEKAGIEGVELYLSKAIMSDLEEVIRICRNFSFIYAIHAPNDCFNIEELAKLVKYINAKIIIFHNIYWEDEWSIIGEAFKNTKAKLCIENTYSVHEPLKFMRRYGLGRCLDLEHLQMECAGIYEEEFIPVIKQASHIHLTGYISGSKLWHTHIHHSPEHSSYLLDLLKKTDYSGFVVSEAKKSLQTYKEFKKLNEFYQKWRNRFVK